MNPKRLKTEYQDEELWFLLDETYRKHNPSNAIIYTLLEDQYLATDSPWTPQMVH